MRQVSRGRIAPLILLLFVLGAIGLAYAGPDELPCVAGEPYGPSIEGTESSIASVKGIPRDCVLLEVFMRPT